MPRRRAGLGAVIAGGAIVVLVALLGAAAPLVTSASPYTTDLDARLAPPDHAHPLGQDALGRDVLARLLRGARISLGTGIAITAISLLVGVLLGAAAGYAGGWLDEALARVIDVLLAFPGLLLAIALAAILGPSLPNVVLALSLLGWTGYARLARAQVAALRQRELTQAARALGATPSRIIGRHLLPLAAPAIVVQATFGLSSAILAEASLSFLGLGAPPPLPSWGSMLDEGRQFMLVAPHLVIVPGLALVGTVLALQLLGDGLQRMLDTRER
ncbi:MAG TPA: ABC transporter permease [Candidatus Binatia bacterium]|jgi:peptide/nickel transport system permease protein|nr:ABC transporter permease [Candidatus Binatia bacterium]